MPYIDWADPEEMFSLLLEWVEDECGEAHDDSGRRRFLAKLVADLTALQDRFTALAPAEGIGSLRDIQRSVAEEFGSDPVMEHLGACIEELERIHGTSDA